MFEASLGNTTTPLFHSPPKGNTSYRYGSVGNCIPRCALLPSKVRRPNGTSTLWHVVSTINEVNSLRFIMLCSIPLPSPNPLPETEPSYPYMLDKGSSTELYSRTSFYVNTGCLTSLGLTNSAAQADLKSVTCLRLPNTWDYRPGPPAWLKGGF